MALNSEVKVIKKAKEVFPDSPIDRSYFIGLAKQESGFNSSAYNPKGDAYGLFQFAGEMRRAYGLNLHSPEDKQLDAGADYIKQLHQKHKGNWIKILAEHYMGIPRFTRAEAGKVDPEVKSFYRSHLPKVEKYAAEYKKDSGKEFKETPPVPRMVENAGFIPDEAETQRTIQGTRPIGTYFKNLVRSYMPTTEIHEWSPISAKVKAWNDEITQIGEGKLTHTAGEGIRKGDREVA